MRLKFLLSVSLLASLTAAHTIPDPNEARFLIQLVQRNNNLEYEGIFIYKNGQARKLLDGGESVDVFYQPHAVAYLGGKDGIYVYDDSTKKLEKYGTVNDTIFRIAKSNNTDLFYIVTEDRIVYKVTEGGTKKTKVDGADGAISIVLDWDNNLYFNGAENLPYVVTEDGVKKIEGLPPNQRVAIFEKAPTEIRNAVRMVWGRELYYIYADGTSRLHPLTDEDRAYYEEQERQRHEVARSVRQILKQQSSLKNVQQKLK